MESVSITTTPVSSFGSFSECMGSWIQCYTICWYWVYLTSHILNSEELLLLPWFLETLSSFIYVPLLSWLVCLPPFSIFLQLFCSSFVIFLPVILNTCPSNPSVWSSWNINLALFLLSPISAILSIFMFITGN